MLLYLLNVATLKLPHISLLLPLLSFLEACMYVHC